MSKNLIFCFDGTCNDQKDAMQDETRTGGKVDDSVTNVLKLHLLFGGNFKKPDPENKQLSLYYSGVGTYGNMLKRAYNAVLAPNNMDALHILKTGLNDFDKYYKDDDSLFIFGFSRGAAIARRFASELNNKYNKTPVSFIGAFDTVASIGIPDLDQDDRPASDVVFENDTIAENIKEAIHLVSIDEKRKAFQPTLMSHEDRVTEVWFSGAHSDVGGSYNRDGLSDITLRFMLDEMEMRKLGLEIQPPSMIEYDNLFPKDSKYEIDFKDLMIRPDVFGKNHQQRRSPLIAAITLADRELRVNEGNKKSDKLPVIYHTVAERIYGDRDYRPKSLQRTPHRVLYPDGTYKEFDGLQHHQLTGMRPLNPLKPGESREVVVFAHKKYNRTGLMLQKQVSYTFEVKGEQTWRDGKITCGPGGWDRDDVKLGLKEFVIAGMEPFRRYASDNAKWFALIGSIGDNDDKTFLIGDQKIDYTPDISGEFCAFANDLDRLYENNMGQIRLTITRNG